MIIRVITTKSVVLNNILGVSCTDSSIKLRHIISYECNLNKQVATELYLLYSGNIETSLLNCVIF